MAEKDEKKEEEFDFITPYLEKIGLEEKKEKKKHEERHLEIHGGEIVNDIIELAKKERKITLTLGIEIVLTVILILMLLGVIPFF